MNDSFALLISSVMMNATTALEDAEFRKKKVVERLVKVSKNYINLTNRSRGISPKLEDQYLMNQHLDGMFELVKEYCPTELNDYCSMILFGNMQGLAKKYEKDITKIAVNHLRNLLIQEKAMFLEKGLQADKLAENERYKELKQVISNLNHNTDLKSTVSVLMSDIEKPLKTAQANHKMIINKINKACTDSYFVQTEGEYAPYVSEFLEKDFMKIAEETTPSDNRTM